MNTLASFRNYAHEKLTEAIVSALLVDTDVLNDPSIEKLWRIFGRSVRVALSETNLEEAAKEAFTDAVSWVKYHSLLKSWSSEFKVPTIKCLLQVESDESTGEVTAINFYCPILKSCCVCNDVISLDIENAAGYIFPAETCDECRRSYCASTCGSEFLCHDCLA